MERPSSVGNPLASFVTGLVGLVGLASVPCLANPEHVEQIIEVDVRRLLVNRDRGWIFDLIIVILGKR
jgi:hypothetical protein